MTSNANGVTRQVRIARSVFSAILLGTIVSSSILTILGSFFMEIPYFGPVSAIWIGSIAGVFLGVMTHRNLMERGSEGISSEP